MRPADLLLVRVGGSSGDGGARCRDPAAPKRVPAGHVHDQCVGAGLPGLPSSVEPWPDRSCSTSTPEPTTRWRSCTPSATPISTVIGISCVAGNSGVEQVVTNTLKVLDAADAAQDIPVARGAAQPMVEAARPEGAFHGPDGLGGVVLPDPTRSAVGADRGGDAVSADHGVLEAVTLVGLAPQTNLAMLLTMYPEVIGNLDRIVFMGGSAGVGNVTAVAEFNVWQDPEAATCVIESPVPTAMYGLDVFTRLAVDQATADRFRPPRIPATRAGRQSCSTAEALGRTGPATTTSG